MTMVGVYIFTILLYSIFQGFPFILLYYKMNFRIHVMNSVAGVLIFKAFIEL